MDKTLEVQPYQTIQGDTREIRGVTHLLDERQIVTCSSDGSLRLWDREGGTQIGNDWRDDEEEVAVETIALSPNGNMVASGSRNGTVRLWDIKTRKVIAKWTGHSGTVWSVCWSADDRYVASGSNDGIVRIWDVGSGEFILGPVFKTGHLPVYAMAYSPDPSKIATCGGRQDGINIWDATTGKLLSTPDGGSSVWSLAWTSDQKKLIAGCYRSVRIFDTATWQEVTVLKDLDGTVYAISLFRNDRLLATASHGKTARVWNLDTGLPVGPPLNHDKFVDDVAWSTDGKYLVTACQDKNAYVWDVHIILKDAGLEELLFVPDVTELMSILDADATPHHNPGPDDTHNLPDGFLDIEHDGTNNPPDNTRHPPQLEDAPRPPPSLPDHPQGHVHSSTTHTHLMHSSSTHSHYSPIPFLRLATRVIAGFFLTQFRRFHPDMNISVELQRRRDVASCEPAVAQGQDSQSEHILPTSQSANRSSSLPARIDHALPPIIDVPLAEGRTRNAADGASSADDGYVVDTVNSRPNSRPTSQKSNLQPPLTEHGGGWLCCRC